MHELTVLVELVDMVEDVAKENDVKHVEKLVLQIGQLSSLVPRFMKEYYPNTIEGTILEGSTLEIESIPGNGLCHHCEKIFNVVQNKGKCPICGADDWELLSGQEFILKEIVVREE